MYAITGITGQVGAPAPCSPRASPYGPSRATPIAPRRGRARLRRRTRRHDRHRRADDGLLKHGRRIRAAAALLRSVARIPRNARGHRRRRLGVAHRAAAHRLPVDDRRAGNAGKPVDAVDDDRAGVRRPADARRVPAPAWFLENAAWDVATARDTGVIHSFLQPLDRSVPMVATETSAARRRPCCRTNGRARASSNSKDRGASARTPLRSPACSGAGASRGRPRDTWAGLFDRQQMRYPERAHARRFQ